MLSGLSELKGKNVSIKYASGYDLVSARAIEGVVTKIYVDENGTFILLDNGEMINIRFIISIRVNN